MTPAVLQALSPAAPATGSRQAGPVAPGDAPASFAAVLDGSVRALSGDEQAESGVQALVAIETSEEAGADAGLVQADPEAAALAGEQPRLDALALMLAAASAPPGQAPPAAAGAGTTAAVFGASPAAAQARAAFDGTAAPLLRPVAAEPPASHPNDGPRSPAAALPPGSTESAAAADLVRAAAAAPRGALRHEGQAAPGPSRQVPAGAAAGDVNGSDRAAHPQPPTAAPMAPATTLSLVAAVQGASDAAPAAIGRALPPGASAAPAAPPQQLSAEPGGEPALPSASQAPDAGLSAAQEVSQTPPGGGLPALATTVATASGSAAQVAPPVGSPGWAPALAQQIVRLPGGGQVELHLNPAELGPLQVKLTLVDSQAQVVFVAEHAAVRQALEAALPQLRTGLAESGINLGQATVGSGAGEQRTGQDGGERPARGEPAAAGDDRVPAKPQGAAPRSGRAGAVDTFA